MDDLFKDVLDKGAGTFDISLAELDDSTGVSFDDVAGILGTREEVDWDIIG